MLPPPQKKRVLEKNLIILTSPNLYTDIVLSL